MTPELERDIERFEAWQREEQELERAARKARIDALSVEHRRGPTVPIITREEQQS